MHVLRRVPEPAIVWITSVAASLAFLLTGPYSNFAPVGFLDPWYYTGYFLHFRYLVHTYGPTYYVSRLPWILPGLTAFRIVSPEAASVILNLAIVSVSAVSLYWSVRWFYGPPAGATAAALLVTNPYFISTVSWDYPDAPSIAYGFAALMCAVRPNGSRRVNSGLTGMFLALSGLTHMTAGPMILAVLAIALWHHRSSPRDLLQACVAISVGAAVVVLALCPVSQILIGRWTYFYWQIYFAILTLRNPADLAHAWGVGPGFLLTAYRLFAPALLLLVGPFLVRLRKDWELASEAYLALAICLGLYALQEFVLHAASLRVQYQSSFMVVPLFFLSGIITGQFVTSWLRAGIIIVAVVALPITFSMWAWPQHPWPILFFLGAITVLLLFLEQLRFGMIALAGLLFLSPALDPAYAYAWDYPTPIRGPNRDAFHDLMTFDAAVQSSTDGSRRLRFWFDRDEPATPFYDSAESLYLWIPADFTRELTTWSGAELQKQVQPNTTFVNLTLHPERIASRLSLLASRGVRVGNERRRTMQYQGATLYIILEDVQSTHGG
ncbi:MAG TPA: glycosyltransferase family 39 protein [Bryobacteraceae bacterium]|nr:glycosyltransferase family 39 protein [Bryobacteraceae bacterium]